MPKCTYLARVPDSVTKEMLTARAQSSVNTYRLPQLETCATPTARSNMCATGDYCDVYLTHDSMSVRKAHNSGRNHLRNVVEYYQRMRWPSLFPSPFHSSFAG